jgi:tRNA(Ile)-lysidine synthase
MLPKTVLTDYRLLGLETGEAGQAQSGFQSSAAGQRLVRPLLEVPRTEVEAYCRQYSLEPRFDRSNLDTTYYRNWLRHEVLPLLTQHNPGVRDVLRRSAQVMAADHALLRSLLADTWPQIVVEEVAAAKGSETSTGGRIAFDLAAWRLLPLALQRSSLREAIHRLRRSLRNINFVHIDDAVQVASRGSTGAQATLPQGLVLVVGYDRITIADAGYAEPLPGWPLLVAGGAVPVAVPGETSLPGSEWKLRATVMDRAELPSGWEDNDDPWQGYLDAETARGGLLLRTRRPGDRFQPQGMGGRTAKLADFYTNQKVPRAARDRLPLLVAGNRACERGRIVWVCGWRVDERALVVAETHRVLLVQFRRAWAREQPDLEG